MQLLILFGLPGAGKTYVGEILQKDFGFFLHDGDDELPVDMQNALSENAHITDDMRDRFFQNIRDVTQQLVNNQEKIVLTQTFIKEKYRKQFIHAFPHAKFLLIETPESVREKRLAERKEYPIDATYAKNMVMLFESPHIPYAILKNDTEGDGEIKKQLQLFLQ